MPSNNAEVLNLSTVAGRNAVKAKQHNKIAIANLTMALVFDGMIGLVNSAVDKSWLGGLACRVIDSLFKCLVLQDMIF